MAKFITILRSDDRWPSLATHLPLAIVTGGVLIASMLLPADGLPMQTCLFLKVTSYPCPLCGMTRAFIAMGHARWSDAWHQSPLAVVLFLGVLAFFAMNVAAMAARATITPGSKLAWNRRTRWFTAVLLTAAVGFNWLYRLEAGLR